MINASYYFNVPTVIESSNQKQQFQIPDYGRPKPLIFRSPQIMVEFGWQT